ncbi:MAG: hypothetical protein JW891_08405 [Candidatus Lokiarchaeota archaeon]|nr:hypothetical protein [Candidatus Lokiarchaeota archaeon]
MMTTSRDEEAKKNGKILKENLFFDDSEEIVLTEQEARDLEEKLDNTKIDKVTRSFFKSSYDFFKRLIKNDFIISLEEIEKL